MTPARLLWIVLLVDLALVSSHLSYVVTFAVLGIGCGVSWLLGRWHERDTAVVHEVSQDLWSVLKQRKR